MYTEALHLRCQNMTRFLESCLRVSSKWVLWRWRWNFVILRSGVNVSDSWGDANLCNIFYEHKEWWKHIYNVTAPLNDDIKFNQGRSGTQRLTAQSECELLELSHSENIHFHPESFLWVKMQPVPTGSSWSRGHEVSQTPIRRAEEGGSRLQTGWLTEATHTLSPDFRIKDLYVRSVSLHLCSKRFFFFFLLSVTGIIIHKQRVFNNIKTGIHQVLFFCYSGMRRASTCLTSSATTWTS